MVNALIPVRSGSKRFPHKNAHGFFGHPLMAYAIRGAIESGQFSEVYVSTDSRAYADIAEQYGARVIMRPEELARDNSPDHEWIAHALHYTGSEEYAVLRATNPFRSVGTIVGAMALFKAHPEVSEVRALRPSAEHPYKTWAMVGEYCQPVAYTEGYLYPTQSLLPTFVQAAGIEIRRANPHNGLIMPYLVSAEEGLDINTPLDLDMAELLVHRGFVPQPVINGTFRYTN